jgi:gluconolactonase
LWSDIPNDRILRWDETTSAVSVFRHPSGNANGNARDRMGRLVTCEHSARRVTRTEYDGSITVIVDRFQGKRLNSPNDVVVASDGAIWFTDPPFGLGSFYEGTIAEPELNPNIYRVDPLTGEAAIAANDVSGPNGLCFSPDEKRLYVVESRAVPNRKIRVFDVIDGRYLGASRVLIDAGAGTPDGFRCDIDGNIWAGWGMGSADLDGVMIFDPEGQPIGRIALPERCVGSSLLSWSHKGLQRPSQTIAQRRTALDPADGYGDLSRHVILIVVFAQPRRKRDPDASAGEPPVFGKIVEDHFGCVLV